MEKHYWILISAMLLNVSNAMAQEQRDAYVFPVKPGTEQWKQFKTGQAMVDASQVPAEVLQRMSTEGLVETCLSYPLLFDIFAANNLQIGFQAVASSFNGLQELLRRPDAGRVLFKVYQTMDPEAVLSKEPSKQAAFTFEFAHVELLLAQPAILNKLTPTERKLLTKESFAKFKAKDNHLDTFGGFGELTTALVLGRILEKDEFSTAYRIGQQSVAMRVFLTTGKVQDTQIINRIVADAQAFAK
jgi:hypothetical protein